MELGVEGEGGRLCSSCMVEEECWGRGGLGKRTKKKRQGKREKEPQEKKLHPVRELVDFLPFSPTAKSM